MRQEKEGKQRGRKIERSRHVYKLEKYKEMQIL